MATSETSTPQVTDESEPAPTQTVVTQRVEAPVVAQDRQFAGDGIH